jgi:hypothetical protein
LVAELNTEEVLAGLEMKLEEDDKAVTGPALDETELDITLEEEL